MKITFRTFLGSFLLCVVTVHAAEKPVSTPPSAPDPKVILMKMAQHLAQAPSFTVTIQSNYDAIQKDGRSVSFGENRLVQ
jgi:hypothetical protein